MSFSIFFLFLLVQQISDDSLLYTISGLNEETLIHSHAIGTGFYDDDFREGTPLFDDDSGNRYRPANMKYNDGYLYVPFGNQMGFTTPSKLGRFSLLSNAWQMLTASSVLTDADACQNLHIHNPLDGVRVQIDNLGIKISNRALHHQGTLKYSVWRCVLESFCYLILYAFWTIIEFAR